MSRRLVLDTNLLVSAALIDHSVSRQAFNKARGEGTLLASQATFRELTSVLARPKFQKYVSETDRLRFVSLYRQAVEMIDVQEEIQACRDPRDDKFLELAVSGRAKAIITGDKDLLVLHPFRGIAILHLKDYLSDQE